MQAEASASLSCEFEAKLVSRGKNEITVELVKPAPDQPEKLRETCQKFLGKVAIPTKELTGLQNQKSFLLNREEWSAMGPNGAVNGVKWAISPGQVPAR